MRRMGTASALHSQSVAKHVGLSSVDLECLDMVFLEGAVTAGQIAKHTRLTTGAVTGLIDRLERKGYVERVQDPKDRRKVVVRIVPKNIAPIQNLYLPLSRATTALMEEFSVDQLLTVATYIERGTELLIARASELDGS